MLCSKRRWLRQQPSWRRLVLCLKRSTMLGSQSCGCKLSEGDWPYHVGEVEQDVGIRVPLQLPSATHERLSVIWLLPHPYTPWTRPSSQSQSRCCKIV
jgi:hypothetical protein